MHLNGEIVKMLFERQNLHEMGEWTEGRYCKFGNFRVTFISRIFDFRIISESLNSRTSTCAVYKAYYNSL